jgi:hypothetical protein
MELVRLIKSCLNETSSEATVGFSRRTQLHGVSLFQKP